MIRSRLMTTALLLTAPLTVCAQNNHTRLTENPSADISFWPRNELDIRQLHSRVAGCLPKGQTSITLYSAAVASMDAGWPPPEWAIELLPESKPLTLRAGECVIFPDTPNGYKQIGGMQPLEVGHTYGFMLLRGNPIKDTEDRRYIGIFCIQRERDGRLSYLPFIIHTDGSITYPSCGGYVGAPAAPDGVVPKDSP